MERFEQQGETGNPTRQLEVCPDVDCGSRLVYPVDWSEHEDQHYLWLRCPECEHREEGVFSVEETDRFARVLDEDHIEFLRQGAKLEMENMVAATEAFVQALVADLIFADDFRLRDIS